MDYSKEQMIYEGKAKKVFSIKNQPQYVIQEFKNSLTAFNGVKKEALEGKGQLNCQISTFIFQKLAVSGISTHWVSTLSATEMVIEKLKMIPLEVVVRNIAAGSLVKRLGFKEGKQLSSPILEFYLKDDILGDPLINEEHALSLQTVDGQMELEELKAQALKVNNILQPLFADIGLILVDFKLEFGKNSQGDIVLGDEISPDTCRLWTQQGEKMDKDRFRQDLDDTLKGYKYIYKKFNLEEL